MSMRVRATSLFRLHSDIGRPGTCTSGGRSQPCSQQQRVQAAASLSAEFAWLRRSSFERPICIPSFASKAPQAQRLGSLLVDLVDFALARLRCALGLKLEELHELVKVDAAVAISVCLAHHLLAVAHVEVYVDRRTQGHL